MTLFIRFQKLAEKAGTEDEDGSAAAKKKKKLKLDMHNSQRFVDGQEVFVWIYDPTPAKHFIIGFLLGARNRAYHILAAAHPPCHPRQRSHAVMRWFVVFA